jgi:hypothetical protein
MSLIYTSTRANCVLRATGPFRLFDYLTQLYRHFLFPVTGLVAPRMDALNYRGSLQCNQPHPTETGHHLSGAPSSILKIYSLLGLCLFVWFVAKNTRRLWTRGPSQARLPEGHLK